MGNLAHVQARGAEKGLRVGWTTILIFKLRIIYWQSNLTNYLPGRNVV